MTAPPDTAMATLLAIAIRNKLIVYDGCIVIQDATDANAGVMVEEADLECLEERGWVTHESDCTTITDAGRYWLMRWLRKNRRAIGVPKDVGLDELVVRGI
jgi:hypothetical protein